MKGVVRHGKKSGEPGLVKCVVFSGTSQRHTETTGERESHTALPPGANPLHRPRALRSGVAQSSEGA